MKKRPTIEDVARRASLSISTVSLVLNKKPNISDAARRKVLKAVVDLGYHPHRHARGLASKLSGNIGFLASEEHFTQDEPFYTRIFMGTEFESRNHDYYVLLTTVGNEFKKGSSSIPRFLLERNVDGLIVAGKVHESLLEHVDKLGLPIVLIDFSWKRKRLSSVLIDNRGGIRAAMAHLLQNGYGKIAFIGGDAEHPSIAERIAAYKESLAESNIEFRERLLVVDEADTRVHNGYNATERMLKGNARPTAVIAANDAMAVGCMRYLKAKGLNVPNDIAVVGFDDIEMSSHVEPRLTTIRVFKEDMGKLAVQRLVEMIKTKAENVVTVHVPVELVVRQSSVPRQAELLKDVDSSHVEFSH